MINELRAVREECRDKPIAFCESVLGINPWSKQREILTSVLENPRTAVRSAHGVGKTFTAAAVVLWFLFTRYPSVVITTAPTWRQVRSILWKEIHRLSKKMEVKLGLPLVPKLDELTTELRIDDSCFALGLATDESEKFQGFHSENLLVIVDEASGIPVTNWDAINGLMTSQGSRLLAIGNPTQTSGEFFDAFHVKRWMYNTIHISAFDSPNLMGTEEERPYLTSKEWVDEKRREWSEDSALWQVRVLGDFPTAEADALIPLSAIETAAQRDVEDDGFIEIGVDIGRYGDSESVLVVRRGDSVVRLETLRQKDLMEMTGWIASFIDLYTVITDDGTKIPPRVRIDEAGMGGGPVDRLKEQGYRVSGINGGSRAYDYEKFANVRTEMYWHLRERFLEGRISIPNDEVLITQLAAIRHKYHSTGAREALIIESKEKMKERGIKSPDRADALALAFMGGIRLSGHTIGTSGEPVRHLPRPTSIASVEQEESRPRIATGNVRRWRRF